MLVLVSGATGLVGNNVVRRLLDNDVQVRVLVRSNSSPHPLEGLAVEKALGDVRDAASVQAAVQGADVVIHAAASVAVGARRLNYFREVNVEGTRHVAEAARAVGASMVHVSTTDAIGIRSVEQPADEETTTYPATRLPYVATKREAEQVVREQVERGLHAVIVNPGFMLGPWDWKPSSGRMLLEVARSRMLLAPRGYFSVCDVRDVADGVIAAAKQGTCGRRYLLAGTTYSYIDACRLFTDVTGGRSPRARMGPAMTKLVGWSGDLWGVVTRNDPEINSNVLAWAAQPKSYTSARAEAELGYRCRSAQESVEDAWSWFLQHGYV